MAHISKIFGGTRRPSLAAAETISKAMGWSVERLARHLEKVRANA